MTRVLAEHPGTLRFTSESGRTELTDDPDGYRLHVTTGTDLWTPDDVHRLLYALAEDQHTAREPEPETYPTPADKKQCVHLRARLVTDVTWYWSEDTGVLYLCTPCWKARMFPLTEAAAARYEALPIEYGEAS